MMCQGFLLFVTAIAGLQLASAQDVTDCTDISIGLETTPIDPVTVPDLPICEPQRAVAQCCSTEYIQERLNITEENFLEGLRIELRERFQLFETLADRLRSFLEGEFLNGYSRGILGNFGLGRGANGLINGFITSLRSRFDYVPGDDDEVEESSRTGFSRSNSTNGFNIRKFLGNVLSGLENAAVRQLLNGQRFDQNVTECVGQVIENQIEEQRMEARTQALQEVRRAMASIENLRAFVRNLTEDLGGFRPLQQCINTVVRLNTCGRCTAIRPPFCQNVCAAIANACYSPFNDALEDQLEQLWEVVRSILNATTGAIQSLNANKGGFNRTATISQISTECGIVISSRFVRQSDDDDDDIPSLPRTIRTAANALRGGPFFYNGRRIRGPGLCRLLNTSSTNCWDGNQTRTTDINNFDADDISDQVNNPVITIPQQTLMEQASSLGTPVSNALNDPSFADVTPLGLVLPGEGGQVIPGNGAATMFITFTSLLSSLLLIVSTFVI